MLDSITGAFASHFGDMPWAPFLIFLAFPASVFVTSLRSVFRLLSWWRMIEDVPTSPTRSAHQGYVELVGHAELMEGPTIQTPMSHFNCVWWSLTIHKRVGGEWKHVSTEQSDELFHLRDAHGVCIVDPEGAQVTSMHRRRSVGGRAKPGIARALSAGADFRYVERYIKTGDPLYVIGWYRTFNSSDHWDHEEELIAKLREWKSDQPALLKRFDANSDGRIDNAEWTAARKAARAEVASEHRQASAQPGVNVICAPQDKRPFLMAAQHQQFFTRSLRLNAVGSALGVVFTAAIMLLMMTARL